MVIASEPRRAFQVDDADRFVAECGNVVMQIIQIVRHRPQFTARLTPCVHIAAQKKRVEAAREASS